MRAGPGFIIRQKAGSFKFYLGSWLPLALAAVRAGAACCRTAGAAWVRAAVMGAACGCLAIMGRGAWVCVGRIMGEPDVGAPGFLMPAWFTVRDC